MSIEGAGTVTVTASQAGNSVYGAAPAVTRTFTVQRAKIQVAADNVIRPVGTANPIFSYCPTGFVHGDNSTVVDGVATESTQATVSSVQGTYPITFPNESLAAVNYAFVYVPGTLTVTAQQCQTVGSYANGFTAAGLSLNRGATIQGSALQLTDGRTSEGRTAFYTSPVLITAFTTDFSFQLLNAVADGFTFAVQSTNATAYGIGGQGLGHQGIPNSAAVKFDLHDNQGEGSDSMGFYQEGVDPTVPDVDLSHTGIDLHCGHTFHVHIAYANAQVAVTLRDTLTGASVSQTFPGDLSTTVGTGA